MKVKIFMPNKDGKIEFNQKDLESLLNEIYEEGYNDGKKNNNGVLNYPVDTRGMDKNNSFDRETYVSSSFPTSITSTGSIKANY